MIPPLLEVTGLTRSFPGVKALDGVDFDLRGGEIHALLGENGAGKSTLIKVLTGVLRPDAGEIRLDGRPIAPRSPAEAAAAGVAAVYQEVNLLPNLSVAENLQLGRQPTRFGVVRRGEMRRRARALLAGYGLDVDVTLPLAAFPVAVRHVVAIARAVDLYARVLILDEPTASLGRAEAAMMFDVLRALRARGVGIVFISHFLDQVFAVADRITVLRNGRRVGEREAAGLDRRDLIALMLGRELVEELSHGKPPPAEGAAPVVAFRRYGRRGLVEPFDLELRAGEVVGAAGLLGSGRSETALLMFGAERADSGMASVDGRETQVRSPRHAMRLGFGLLAEERKTDGIVGALSLRENIVLALQARRGWWRRLPRRRQRELVDRFIALLDIRTPGPETPIEQLSGGNQQKALLGRALATEPRLLILDEPTRGVDVGAHAEIVRLIEQLRAGGAALYVVSSELDEVVAYSDRVCVMRDRRQAAVLEGDDVRPERILQAIAAAHTGVAT